MVLIVTKLGIRLIDYENSRLYFNPLGFDLFIILVTITCVTTVLLIVQSFNNLFGASYFLFFEVFLVLFLYIYKGSTNDSTEAITMNIFNWFSLMIGFCVFLYIFNNWVEKFQILITNLLDA